MKITFSNNPSKTFTEIILVKGSDERFIERAGQGSVLSIGMGKRKNVNQRRFILLCRKIIQIAKKHKLTRISIQFEHAPFAKLKGLSETEIASLMAQNFEMANFEFTKFRTKPKEGWPEIKEVMVKGKASAAVRSGFRRGQVIGQHVNNCRELANAPAGDMTPALLAEAARNAVKGTSVNKVTVLDEKQLEKLKMGAVLGVARGSSEKPRFIIMEYWGNGKPASSHDTKKQPLVFIGKGVTFDTGGVDLKLSGSALGMHLDMSGGAAVIHALALISKLKLKKNVIGLIPAVENMLSGSSYRPGDLLRSMSGKTIEIRNTDAEGRVILADAITYSRRYNPRLVVDVATLTGAALVALGQRCNAIMTKDIRLQNLFVDVGEKSGDYMWPLPLWEEYEKEVKGKRGDVTNTHHKDSRYGGAINGGIFLHEFARGLPWVHIDIAPRMESIEDDHLADGAAGEPVRFLLKLAETY